MFTIKIILEKRKSKKKNKKTELIFVTKINHSIIKILKMEIIVKDFADTHLALVDHLTQAPIVATISNIVLLSSDPTIFATGTDVVSGLADIIGVAIGAASLKVTADVEYTDILTNLLVKGSKSADVPVTVTAPLPTAENTDLIVTFGTPAPIV